MTLGYCHEVFTILLAFLTTMPSYLEYSKFKIILSYSHEKQKEYAIFNRDELSLMYVYDDITVHRTQMKH
jgi:hypothetical protein